MNSLSFRRQFLLTRRPMNDLESWPRCSVAGFLLYTHPDLRITVSRDSTRTLTLLGYLFDPVDYQAGDQAILDNILAASEDFRSFILALKPFVGRYVIFYQDPKCLNLIQDALALREVYYCQTTNDSICGSQPNLLVRFSSPQIHEASEPEVQDFVHNHLPRVRNGRLWAGDGTPFVGVKHLLPNHYLDINIMESYRYWPNTSIERLEIGEAVSRCAKFLRGALKAAAHRHSLMMAVTAGEDSRTLLAASREICGSIYYFINKHEGLTDKHPDIRIPKELFRRIKLPFNVHNFPNEVPNDFIDIFLNNTFYSRKEILPVIYHIYYKQHRDKLNILGVGEVGRTKFFNRPILLTPYYLAFMLRYRRSPFAVRECKTWLANTDPIAKRYGLNIMTLFWWEVLIGNWGAVGNSESDIAIEEFDPYDSHYLYEMFLSVDAKYRTFRNNILFRELIKFMWPQLLELPINPPDNKKDWLYIMLHWLRLENLLRTIKARLYEISYQLYWKRRKRHPNP